MSPGIKLTYFNIPALAEPIRILLKYGGVDFEDERIYKAVWPELKSKTPFGQVPVYEEGGKIAHQSIAVARYVAKKVKLVGETDWENLEIDSVVDTVNDLRQKIALYAYEKDPAVQKVREEPLFNETIPYYLNRLDEIAEKNDGHLAVGKLTWADVYFVGLLGYLEWMTGLELIEDYENLTAVKKNVLDVPAVKNWFETRPDPVL